MLAIPVSCLFAAEMSATDRIMMCGIMGLVGTIVILKGIENIRTGKAEETGIRRLVNTALGQSNSYEGTTARVLGGLLVASGVLLIIVGIVVVIWGPFLA